MLIIGHRGAAGLEAENTISSFKKAQELGVDMIETDLRWAGKIVLSHNKPNRAEKLVELDELLQNFRQPLNLELKEGGFETQLLEKLKNFSSEVLISSKHPAILKKIRTLDGNIKLGLILGSGNFFLLPFLRQLDRQIGFYSIHPKNFLAHKIIINYLRRLNKQIYVWTVNNLNQFEKLKALQVDGVFTDFPNIISAKGGSASGGKSTIL